MIRDILDRGQDRVEQTASTVSDAGSLAGTLVSDTASDFGSSAGSFVDDTVSGAQQSASDAASSATESVTDATGVTYLESDRGRQRQQEAREAESIWQGFDTAVATGTDFVLDNPNWSAQETTRSGISTVTGAEDDEELAEQFQSLDEGITSRIDESIEDTALDNIGTDYLRSGTDMFLTEGGRVIVGAGTGIDVAEGDTDARTGALELGDVALTGLTAGLGRSVAGLARGSDNLFDLGSRGSPPGPGSRSADDAVPTSRGDDAVPTSQADDAVPTQQADEITPSGGQADSALPTPASQADEGSSFVRQADEATPSVSPSPSGTGRSADDVFNIGPGRGGRSGDNIIDIGPARTARSADDVAGAAGRGADDVAGAAARSADDVAGAAARSGDTLASRVGSSIRSLGGRAGRAGQRAGSRARSGAGRFGRSRTGRLTGLGLGVGTGLVAGGALITELQDRYEMADGTVIVMADTYPSTEVYDGGTLFRIKELGGETLGYTVVIAIDPEEGEVIMIDEDGEPITAPLSLDELDNLAADPGGGS